MQFLQSNPLHTHNTQASLLLGANDLVNCGSRAELDVACTTTGTVMILCNVIASTTNTFVCKDNASFLFNILTGGPNFQCQILRATQNLNANGALANLPNYAAGKFIWLAFMWDLAGANGDQQLWCGDQMNEMAEATAYTTQRPGTGAVTDTTALDLLFGNRIAGNVGHSDTFVAAAMFSRRLAPWELREQQKEFSKKFDNIGLWFFGANGSKLVPDLSGYGNHGIVTGGTTGAKFPYISDPSRV